MIFCQKKSLKIRHLEVGMKVTCEAFPIEKYFYEFHIFFNRNTASKVQTKKRLLKEPSWIHQIERTQSPNIFCFNSRRCWASSDKLAVGRANKRPTPMGSPVSSQ
jgi:hypothetical protein